MISNIMMICEVYVYAAYSIRVGRLVFTVPLQHFLNKTKTG